MYNKRRSIVFLISSFLPFSKLEIQLDTPLSLCDIYILFLYGNSRKTLFFPLANSYTFATSCTNSPYINPRSRTHRASKATTLITSCLAIIYSIVTPFNGRKEYRRLSRAKLTRVSAMRKKGRENYVIPRSVSVKEKIPRGRVVA